MGSSAAVLCDLELVKVPIRVIHLLLTEALKNLSCNICLLFIL